MTQRERLVVELLRNMHIADSATRVDLGRGGGDGIPMLAHSTECRYLRCGPCSCWLKSIAEIQRCLRELYKHDRKTWRAVYERYVAAERRPRTVLIRGRRPVTPSNWEILGLVDKSALNKRGDGEVRILVESWRDDVKAADWDAGVRWIAAAFKGSPMLPRELRLEEAA